jgi:uncharacterized membrane protein
MFGRSSRVKMLKEKGASGGDLAVALAKDRRFRRELLAAVGQGARARRRVRRQVGTLAVARRLASDAVLRRRLLETGENLRNVWSRVEKKRSHRRRNFLLAVGLGGGAVAVATRPEARRWVSRRASRAAGATLSQPRTITEAIEVSVPVSMAYNQWTQFEDFPLFMAGVDHVQQLDDTRLRWSATVAGKSAEWDAKILEQHRDRQISWISDDGKPTRGTITFEELAPARTLVRVSMSYRAEGVAEAAGSAVGLDSRRVRGDLDRFKELIEGRAADSGAWRGEIKEGEVTR